jgi:UDP-N-acetylmuramoylalanine--D-glutamate ligase
MIPLKNAKNHTYLVLGYGTSGRATAKALEKSGATIFVHDDKEASREAAEADGYSVYDPDSFDFSSLEAVIAGPGVPLTHPKPHPVIKKARDAKIKVLSDLDLLFSAQPKATYVGITGTNGKSTTTALIAHILDQAGRKIQLGGNIGNAALSLEPLDKDGIYVLELSSYQLDLIQSNPFNVAVWLNITPDHLDRHGDMAGYIKAKKKIVRENHPQTLVLGTDEPEMRALASELALRKNLKINLISASEDLVLSKAKALPGTHNAQNIAAATYACAALSLSEKEIEAGVMSFPGLAHRQQLVGEKNGVRFINDSKATNANASSKALGCYDNIYWIIGGRPKSGGLAGLETFAPRIAHAFLIGEAETDFAAWCRAQNIPHTSCGTLAVATKKAALIAFENKEKDSVILLSPACASFDQFKSFEQRGEMFAETVKEIIAG